MDAEEMKAITIVAVVEEHIVKTLGAKTLNDYLESKRKLYKGDEQNG